MSVIPLGYPPLARVSLSKDLREKPAKRSREAAFRRVRTSGRPGTSVPALMQTGQGDCGRVGVGKLAHYDGPGQGARTGG